MKQYTKVNTKRACCLRGSFGRLDDAPWQIGGVVATQGVKTVVVVVVVEIQPSTQQSPSHDGK
jgi:hypothetical protein